MNVYEVDNTLWDSKDTKFKSVFDEMAFGVKMAVNAVPNVKIIKTQTQIRYDFESIDTLASLFRENTAQEKLTKAFNLIAETGIYEELYTKLLSSYLSSP